MNDIVETPQPELPITSIIESGLLTRDELSAMPIGTRIMFAPQLRKTFTGLAKAMAGDPMTPPHLKENESACFHVIRLALAWNADFYQVAKHTYSPAPGQLAIDGAAAVGAMLGSRRVIEIRHEHFGDWDKLAGKFEMVTSKYKDGNVKKDKQTGEPIMVPKAIWKPEDEAGLGLITTAIMHDGREVSTPKIYMNQCYPRNSAQWWLAPARQICNVGSRAVGMLACGELFLGITIDAGMEQNDDRPTYDITPPEPVDVTAEGIQGGGESEPGTPNGVVDEEETKTTRKRVKLTFRGKEMYKTAFIRDVKQTIDRVETIGDLEMLSKEIDQAIDTVEDVAAAGALADEVLPLMQQARSEFDEVPEDVADTVPQSTLSLAGE